MLLMVFSQGLLDRKYVLDSMGMPCRNVGSLCKGWGLFVLGESVASELLIARNTVADLGGIYDISITITSSLRFDILNELPSKMGTLISDIVDSIPAPELQISTGW